MTSGAKFWVNVFLCTKESTEITVSTLELGSCDHMMIGYNAMEKC